MHDDILNNFSAEAVLKGLHGFQRDAVEQAFHRLYKAEYPTNRYLIADEVGLGKTMIARGILAKALEEMRDTIDRIDIVYICSNLSIAAQNLNRLNPIKELVVANADRITMLPVRPKGSPDVDFMERKVNFVAFTPGTSLELKTSTGKRKERLLLYAILQELWDLTGTPPLNVFMANITNYEYFRQRAWNFRSEYDISPSLEALFHKRLKKHDSECKLKEDAGLKERFFELCDHFKRHDSKPDYEIRQKRNYLIGELRALLAEVCIQALEPDLIILDEFQRFKHLLSTETEAGQLANQLFNWSDKHAVARVLLLSATPYKAYTLQHELAEDDHYKDFISTLRFLQNSQENNQNVSSLLSEFRRQLYALPASDGSALRETRARIEQELKKVMSRTERLAVVNTENGMLKTIQLNNLEITRPDLSSYQLLNRLGEYFGQGDGMEYWKSAAYPFNFMDSYQLKNSVRDALSNKEFSRYVDSLKFTREGDLLSFERIKKYQEIEIPNAKTRQLVTELEQLQAFDILWLPPSAPYYCLSEDYAKAAEAGITKRLVFSAWHLVPRSLAVLLSYQSERHVFCKDEESPENTAEARSSRRGLLRFSLSEGRLTGLSVLTLLFPSRVLAELCDPRVFARERGTINHKSGEVLAWAVSRIQRFLDPMLTYAEEDQAADQTWYWAAPFLLEREKFASAMDNWWQIPDLADFWSGQSFDDDEDTKEDGWRAHVEEAKDYAMGNKTPQGPAPKDLPTVLALMALAGPGTCALRSLLTLYPAEPNKGLEQRRAASRIAWGFRSIYNRPESMALIRGGKRGMPYWRMCLQHGLLGCLAAVVDEYTQVLRDSCGLTLSEPDKACPQIAETALAALNIRTATLVIDNLYKNPDTGMFELEKKPMRSLFAMRFGSDKMEDQAQVQRDTVVRSAFNSPFWPFVLATTSVGQEGLDFHWYCHAITHWNLPSNPVELEQREGRIHRFKGHAIRKNIAKKHLQEVLASRETNLWELMFRTADLSIDNNGRGLIPYWLYQVADGAWIERHIPMYPLSKDIHRYTELLRSLGAYRIVFGQPRQDELIEYLLDNVDKEKLELYVKTARIDLSPETRQS